MIIYAAFLIVSIVVFLVLWKFSGLYHIINSEMSASVCHMGSVRLCCSFMDPEEEAKYAAFEKKVKRTVCIDNLSPQVTESDLKTAINQFGNVKSVQFIPNYLEAKSMPHAALVEMENEKQAEYVIAEMANFPFMMSGMPRPVRACAAEMEMFDDRPKRPGRRISYRWLDSKDPDFEVGQKIKRLVRKNASGASYLLKVNNNQYPTALLFLFEPFSLL